MTAPLSNWVDSLVPEPMCLFASTSQPLFWDLLRVCREGWVGSGNPNFLTVTGFGILYGQTLNGKLGGLCTEGI